MNKRFLQWSMLLVVVSGTGCGPAPAPIKTPAAPVAPHPQGDIVPPVTSPEGRPAGRKVVETNAWFYADSFAGLHAVREEALEDGRPPRRGRLTPYADAVMWRGETVGVRGDAFSFIRIDPPQALDGVVMAHMDGDRPRPRTLDAFEEAALAALEEGAAWVFEDVGPRAVGALRNTSECRRCHYDAPTGGLLGAYGYRFSVVADD